MKRINRIVLGCMAISLMISSGYAGPPNLITISNQMTTQVTLANRDILNITSSGGIKIQNIANSAIDSQSRLSILNDGNVDINITDPSTHNVYGIGQHINMYYWLSNSGTISVTSNGTGNTIGISQDTTNSIGSGITNDINNTGVINVYSNGNSYASGIVQMSFVGNISGNINNTGVVTIDVNGSRDSTGLTQMSFGGTITGNINNTGVITTDVNGSSLSTGIMQMSLDGNITGNITNSGTIDAKSSGVGNSTGIVQYSQNGIITGNITNSGTINALLGVGIDSNTSGNITNSGTINADSINVGLANFTNSGTINLHGSTSSSAKYYTQTSTGVLSIDANLSANGTATNPHIIASSSALIADGSTINVNVIGNGVERSFLDNNGTINGVITSSNIDANVTKLNITDNSPILNFQAFMNDTNTSLSLEAIAANTSVTPQNSPLTAVSTQTIGLQTLNMLNSIVQTRQNDIRGLGSGDIAFSDKHMWVKPFGAYTKQDDKDGLNGFSANTYGMGLGFDGEYKEGRRAGFALFISNTNLDVNHVVQSNDLNTYNFVAYGSQPIVDDKSVLFYQAGFGIQKNSTTRYDETSSQIAKANYTSKDFYIQAKATKDYDINDKLRITPAIKGVYRYFYSPSYRESGAGATNLSVESKSTTQMLLGVMTDLRYKIDENTDFISDVGLMYDLRDDANSINAIFQGTPDILFTTTGIKNSALSYNLGLGLSKHLKKDLILNVKYTLSGTGSDLINHALIAKFRWKF
ncbi:MAG: autotransporter domain-containing protein [Sulfurospirillaceae bacterium]|nr:autotransporter domain-containing protein [Sulfurospirillaceae bacterium]